MAGPTQSHTWDLHPGDIVIAEPYGEFFKIVARTPNDLEATALLKDFQARGKTVVVFTARGIVH